MIVNQLNRLQLEVLEIRKRLDAHDRMFQTFDRWTNKIANGIDKLVKDYNNDEYSRCL